MMSCFSALALSGANILSPKGSNRYPISASAAGALVCVVEYPMAVGVVAAGAGVVVAVVAVGAAVVEVLGAGAGAVGVPPGVFPVPPVAAT